MIKRPFWMAVGAAVGVGGTLWAEQKVRRRMKAAADAVGPLSGADGWAAAAREAQGRLKAAAQVASRERSRREDELWERITGRPAIGAAAGPRSETRRGSGRADGHRRARR